MHVCSAWRALQVNQALAAVLLERVKPDRGVCRLDGGGVESYPPSGLFVLIRSDTFKAMKNTLFIRIRRCALKSINPALVAMVLGFIMVLVAQLLGMETEYSLSPYNGISFKSRPVPSPHVIPSGPVQSHQQKPQQSD